MYIPTENNTSPQRTMSAITKILHEHKKIHSRANNFNGPACRPPRPADLPHLLSTAAPPSPQAEILSSPSNKLPRLPPDTTSIRSSPPNPQKIPFSSPVTSPRAPPPPRSVPPVPPRGHSGAPAPFPVLPYRCPRRILAIPRSEVSAPLYL